MRRYLRVIRRRDFALLWAGATVSALGDGMSFIALVWLVLEHTDNPGAVGGLAAAYTAPVLVGGLAAGLVLDRWDRRRVLVVDNLVRGLAVASVPVAAALGILTTTHLYLAAGVYGLLFMASLAGIPSLLPALVEPDELVTANAMESLAYGIAGLAGPAMAGVVIALLGAPAVLALDAVTYGVFVACLLSMRRPAPVGAVHETGPDGAEAAARRGLGPAVRFVLGTPAILAITVLFMAVNIGEGMFTVLLPLYSRDVLGGDAATYGLLASAFASGALAGTLVVGAAGWRWPLGRSIAVAVCATGLVFALLLPAPPLPATIGILVLAGLLASSLTPWAQTIRMRLIPAALRGRVFALLRTLMQATPPVGALLAGAMLAGGDVAPVIAAIVAIIAVPGAIAMVHPALGPMATAEPDPRPAAQPSTG